MLLKDREHDLIDARKKQAESKMKLLELQAIQDKDEFNRILENQKLLKSQELQKERDKHDKVPTLLNFRSNSMRCKFRKTSL